MIRIIDEKCSGKTKKLIEKAFETGGTIACKNVYSTRAKVVAYGFYNIKIISYFDLINKIEEAKNTNGQLSNIYIDELEEFVNLLLVNGLAGYTMSKED